MVYHSSTRLAERVVCYIWQGRGNNCNSVLLPGVLRGERQHVLIDPGSVRNELGEPCFDSLAQAVGADGFRTEDVGLVIGSHSHPDHIEAAELMAEKNGALFALSREEDEFYRSTGKAFFQAFLGRQPQLDAFLHLAEGELLLGAKDSKMTIRVLLTPGHSPGSISLHLEEERILVSGDVVFAGSIGRTDFPGGSPGQLRQSLERLSRLDVQYLVAGHGTEGGSIIAGTDRIMRNFAAVKMFL